MFAEEKDRFTVGRAILDRQGGQREAAELELTCVRARFDGQVGRSGTQFQVPAIREIAKIRERVERPIARLNADIVAVGLDDGFEFAVVVRGCAFDQRILRARGQVQLARAE